MLSFSHSGGKKKASCNPAPHNHDGKLRRSCYFLCKTSGVAINGRGGGRWSHVSTTPVWKPQHPSWHLHPHGGGEQVSASSQHTAGSCLKRDSWECRWLSEVLRTTLRTFDGSSSTLLSHPRILICAALNSLLPVSIRHLLTTATLSVSFFSLKLIVVLVVDFLLYAPKCKQTCSLKYLIHIYFPPSSKPLQASPRRCCAATLEAGGFCLQQLTWLGDFFCCAALKKEPGKRGEAWRTLDSLTLWRSQELISSH